MLITLQTISKAKGFHARMSQQVELVRAGAVIWTPDQIRTVKLIVNDLLRMLNDIEKGNKND